MSSTTLRRGVLLVFVVAPLLATAYAMVELWNEWIGWLEFSLFLGLYLLTGLGITIGFHRMLTHRSFETGPVLKALFLIFGSMAAEGHAIDWAANHLKHHAHSDEDGDPHSPLDGFFHAHVGWLFRMAPAERERYCKRHLQDPIIVFVDKTFLVWVALGYIIPYLIAGWEGILWGGLVRMAVVNHVTWAVNSVCHTFGSRPFNIKDQSRNNWLIGLLAFGEGWHHNHHAFPGMAYHGMTWRQFDLSSVILWLLARLGLVWDVKFPSPEVIERRRRKPAAVQVVAD